MSRLQKKSPNEYSLYAFRLAKEQKNNLNALLETVRNTFNKKLEPADKIWIKNNILFEALMIGLPVLKKNGNKERLK